MNRVVAVLMLGLFGIGSAEFVVAGVLPRIAGDLGISIASAGSLVSVYALTVVIAGPLLTLAVSALPRRPLMIALMVVFAASNLLAALAPGFAVLLVARVLSALVHCTFFALSLVVGTATVAADRQGTVIARLAIGLNLANVLGVPLGVLVANEMGWRALFWALTVLGLLAAGLLALVVPAQATTRTGAAAELRSLGRGKVLVAIAISALGCGGAFTAYTYVAPLLEDVSGFGTAAIAPLLLLFGLGTLGGSLVGGKLVDRALMPTLCGALAVLAAVLGVMSFVSSTPWAAVVALTLFGVAFGAILPGLQARVMQASQISAPTLALAVNIAAMNIGIAFGAWLGGRVLDGGLGLPTVLLAGAAVAFLALVVAAVELLRDRAAQDARPDEPVGVPAAQDRA